MAKKREEFIKAFKKFVAEKTTNAITEIDLIEDYEWSHLFDAFENGVSISEMIEKIAEADCSIYEIQFREVS